MAFARLGAVALDCPDPTALAGFYQQILGGEIEPSDTEPDWVELVGAGSALLAFQEAPGHIPPKWPSEDGSQQFHLDLMVPDLDAGEEQVLALGAKVLDNEDKSRTWRVYADPAGHPFCLCVG
ncbi:VOC family protein [Streptomyces albipurpureus]|uniref:VOC family protein n=1 Tax=Streptomyces albipurpureus TaxID=2897419 RepID=A0ABT0UNB5_9ACTN|nr:VOC family protein [Streptomyces sp. CWNU-1]MCM2390097.1 VOC family protein [Streptomyces sp. CWNU-1]